MNDDAHLNDIANDCFHYILNKLGKEQIEIIDALNIGLNITNKVMANLLSIAFIDTVEEAEKMAKIASAVVREIIKESFAFEHIKEKFEKYINTNINYN